jgi:mRNA-degrading endonuclease RelE of RelBE toxin-antitoxin system
MSYNIVPTHRFEKELKRLVKKFPSLKNEFAQLIQNLEENPETGTFIGNNCYKIRMAIASKGKGKSGGARVISYFILKQTRFIFLLCMIKVKNQI